jgi:hypothetical protein
MADTHPSPKSQVSAVERWEPARAVLRPRACDERAGCWVKVGPRGCDNAGGGTNHCKACGGAISVAGSETAHLRAVDRIRRELRAERHAEV